MNQEFRLESGSSRFILATYFSRLYSVFPCHALNTTTTGELALRMTVTFGLLQKSVQDALWIAALKGDGAHIAVQADCEHMGIKTVAHVGINIKKARGKSVEEIFCSGSV